MDVLIRQQETHLYAVLIFIWKKESARHVWMDITDLNAFICAPTLILVDGVWRGNVSVQKKAVTQEPDVEVVFLSQQD